MKDLMEALTALGFAVWGLLLLLQGETSLSLQVISAGLLVSIHSEVRS